MKEEKMSRWITIIVALLTIAIPIICYIYSLDKTQSVMGDQLISQEKEIQDIKREQESKFNRIDNKLDDLSMNMKNISISLTKISTYIDIKLGKDDRENV